MPIVVVRRVLALVMMLLSLSHHHDRVVQSSVRPLSSTLFPCRSKVIRVHGLDTMREVEETLHPSATPVLLVMTELRRALRERLQDVPVPHSFFTAGTTFPDRSVDEVFMSKGKLLIILMCCTWCLMHWSVIEST